MPEKKVWDMTYDEVMAWYFNYVQNHPAAMGQERKVTINSMLDEAIEEGWINEEERERSARIIEGNVRKGTFW